MSKIQVMALFILLCMAILVYQMVCMRVCVYVRACVNLYIADNNFPVE